ncbi:hypothetical protein [Streptomyces sp. NPDC056405]|uniref:hypothetical protein n=1 Tax=Streptomyces sp. NPDC056405 TaxID=3345811 RepID=UPI0035DAD26A
MTPVLTLTPCHLKRSVVGAGARLEPPTPTLCAGSRCTGMLRRYRVVVATRWQPAV